MNQFFVWLELLGEACVEACMEVVSTTPRFLDTTEEVLLIIKNNYLSHFQTLGQPLLPGSPFAFLKALGLAAVLKTHEPTS